MEQPISYVRQERNDCADLRAEMERGGHIQIPDFLTDETAHVLHSNLRSRPDWIQVLNSGPKVIDLPRAIRDSLSSEKAAELDSAVYAGGRYEFQYRYESVRVPDDLVGQSGASDPVLAFAQWMNAPEQLALWRSIMGVESINFVDAQATAYSPGDFLTGHDDNVPGKGRHAAYVFSLNPLWRVEWGGLLLFHERAARKLDDVPHPQRVSGLVPAFNCLNIFKVPVMHSVSLVSPSAANRRYGITGWIRSI